jgi:hypothetical protein
MDEQDAYTITEFCAKHRVGRAFYYKIQARGIGPKEMRVGAKVLISREAAAAWRHEREVAGTPQAA